MVMGIILYYYNKGSGIIRLKSITYNIVTIRVGWLVDRRLYALGCSDRYVACACDSDFVPWVQVRRSTTTPTGAANAHPLSSPWSGPRRLIPCVGGYRPNNNSRLRMLFLCSLHSHCLCHQSSFSCVCGRLSRRTTLSLRTPVQALCWSRAPRST